MRDGVQLITYADRLARWGAAPQPRVDAGPRLNADSLTMDAYEAGRPSEQEAWRLGDARFIREG